MTAPLRILLVDDDPSVRELTTEMLAFLGHHVTAVASGPEALACVRSGAGFDVVVTDQSMPEIPGDELIRSLGTLAPAIRCLLVTGHADPGDITPGAAVLRKPYRSAQLAAALASLVA
jgi:CheY-like chemotaxis protein